MLLFVGLMSYFPNADAVDYLLDEIFPRIVRHMPQARLLIVGADPPLSLRLRAGPNIEVTGYVPRR